MSDDASDEHKPPPAPPPPANEEKPQPTPRREPIMQEFHGSDDRVPRRRPKDRVIRESDDGQTRSQT